MEFKSSAVSGLLQHLYSSSSTSGNLTTSFATVISKTITPKKIGSKIRITVSAMWYCNGNYMTSQMTQTGGSGTFSSNNSNNRFAQNAYTGNIGFKYTETFIFENNSLNATTFNFQAKYTGGSTGVGYAGCIIELEEIGV